jgi:glycogen phosphorylase
MIEFVRGRHARQLEAQGETAEAARRISGEALDPEAFTIGFSRRFALYKRAGLLFGDRKRARRLFNDPRRPVQIIFAGKPHPEDRRGAEQFEEILAVAREPGFAGKVFLVPNYDMEVARHLVGGVDLWLNTPRRPQEASGTSGQKVSPNGGLNLSILDGWWDEGCDPKAGWAFGKPIDYADRDLQDREDRDDLYRILVREVIPLYFDRDRRCIPRGWLRLVRSSMGRLVPAFSSARMLLEYGRLYYRPASENGRALASAGGRKAREIAAWRGRVASSWPLVHALRTERGRGRGRGEVDLFVAGLGPADLSARLLIDSGDRLPVAGRPAGDGVVRFSFPAPRRGPARLRVWPSHPALPHACESGPSLDVEV